MKKIYRMIMPVMLAAMLCGCGDKREDEWEDSRSGREDRQEESVPSPTAEPTPEPTEKPLLTSAFASAKPGNELQFGTCEQDNNLSNGAEPIEWVVLANEGDKILVLSKYVLDGEVSYKYGEQVTWETSAERELLNNTFYEEAFSEEEKRCILESSITTPDTEGFWRGRSQSFQTNGGSATSDFLFFLSSEEVEEYVQPLGIAAAETTAASTVRVEESTGYSCGCCARRVYHKIGRMIRQLPPQVIRMSLLQSTPRTEISINPVRMAWKIFGLCPADWERQEAILHLECVRPCG